MKTILVLTIIISTSFTSWAQSDPADGKKIEIVKTYLQYAFDQEIEKQKALMHANILDYHPTVLQEPARGREELIKGWQSTTASMESVTYESNGIGILSFEEGELAGKWVVASGIIISHFNGVATPVRSQMVGFYKIENRLITEVRNFGNIMDIYQQLGYTLTPSKQD